MNLSEIGKIVYDRRKMLNLRQEDLSEMSEVNIKTISQIESGNGNPSYITLAKIFEILGLDLHIAVKQSS